MKRHTDDTGVKHEPEISQVTKDMLERGGTFAWKQVDTSKYLLPQRRNRVYGVVSQQEQRVGVMEDQYVHAMELLESYARWPVDEMMFSTDTGPELVLTKRVQDIVATLLEESKGIQNLDLFLDTSTSTGRKKKESAHAMSTCLRPSHKVYSVTCTQTACAGFCQSSHHRFRFHQ